MLNININYPYPVIREYTDDYQSTEFIGELKVLLEPDGYAVHTNFEINNKGIQILLSKRILTYALEVQCVSTWFRKLYTIHENRVIRLDPQMIHERVELIPCIVVATSIEGFTNEDFAEEYQDMKFDLNAGDIIGIGQKRTFDALYQNDIIKNGSSIVDVGGNDKLKEIQCDFSQSTIKLTLPADQYENYRSCGYNRSKYKMLNAKNGIDYVLVGDYYIPDLKLPEEERPIGKYGRMHREYLRENHPILFNELALRFQLWTYLADINEQAQERFQVIISQMQKAESVTEKMKADNQWEWIQRMGSIHNRAEEIVLNELIYSC